MHGSRVHIALNPLMRWRPQPTTHPPPGLQQTSSWRRFQGAARPSHPPRQQRRSHTPMRWPLHSRCQLAATCSMSGSRGGRYLQSS